MTSRLQRLLQAVPAPAQEAQRYEDVAAALPELLKTPEAMSLLRFDGPRAIHTFFKWADRHHVPRLHRGRTCLWEKRVLLDFLHGKAWTKRRHGRDSAA